MRRKMENILRTQRTTDEKNIMAEMKNSRVRGLKAYQLLQKKTSVKLKTAAVTQKENRHFLKNEKHLNKPFTLKKKN